MEDKATGKSAEETMSGRPVEVVFWSLYLKLKESIFFNVFIYLFCVDECFVFTRIGHQILL